MLYMEIYLQKSPDQFGDTGTLTLLTSPSAAKNSYQKKEGHPIWISFPQIKIYVLPDFRG